MQIRRDDVATVFPFWPGASTSGFALTAAVPSDAFDSWVRIDVDGLVDRRPVARLRLYSGPFCRRVVGTSTSADDARCPHDGSRPLLA